MPTPLLDWIVLWGIGSAATESNTTIAGTGQEGDKIYNSMTSIDQGMRLWTASSFHRQISFNTSST